MKRILILLALAACEIPEAPKPYASWPNQEWAQMTEKEIVAYGVDKLTPSDAKEFCPTMSLRNWVHLMGAVAHFESGFKPGLEYKENFKNGAGEWTISTGLFQLSYHTQRSVYGFKDATTEKLKDPAYNIKAAVHIMHRWIKQDGMIANHSGTTWRGMSRYWSVMRTTGKLPNVKARLKPHCE